MYSQSRDTCSTGFIERKIKNFAYNPMIEELNLGFEKDRTACFW